MTMERIVAKPSPSRTLTTAWRQRVSSKTSVLAAVRAVSIYPNLFSRSLRTQTWGDSTVRTPFLLQLYIFLSSLLIFLLIVTWRFWRPKVWPHATQVEVSSPISLHFHFGIWNAVLTMNMAWKCVVFVLHWSCFAQPFPLNLNSVCLNVSRTQIASNQVVSQVMSIWAMCFKMRDHPLATINIFTFTGARTVSVYESHDLTREGTVESPDMTEAWNV